jgi:hypothetical protein
MNVVMQIWKTIKILREEIRDLKHCQVQYFTLSVTATCAILGFGSTLNNAEMRWLAMLSPLSLLLPCWVIFFDKATGISRILGYQSVLEELIERPPFEYFWFLGYASALNGFRIAQDKGELKVNLDWQELRLSVFVRLLFLRTRHRFLMLNWYTFFILSLLCCTLSFNFSYERIVYERIFDFHLPFFAATMKVPLNDFVKLSYIFVVLVAIYTFVLIVKLTVGKHSYRNNRLAWNKLRIAAEEERRRGALP